jgi:hypothetical protein
MPHRPVPLWYVLVAVMVSLLLTTAAGVIYTNHVQRESDRRWCELLGELAGGPPPESERGRAVMESMQHLREQFGCE